MKFKIIGFKTYTAEIDSDNELKAVDEFNQLMKNDPEKLLKETSSPFILSGEEIENYIKQIQESQVNKIINSEVINRWVN